MSAILSITAPIYLLMLVGYLAVGRAWFHKGDLAVLGRFVLQFALPALVFRALTQQPLSAFWRPDYLLVYAAGAWLTIAVGWAWSRRVARQPPDAAVISAMGMACSNSGFVGYPILLLALPEQASAVLALNMVVENLLVLPLLMWWADWARSSSGHASMSGVRPVLMRVMRTPLMLGLGAGLVVAMSGWTLPLMLTRSVDLLAAGCAGISLVMIGGSLRGFRWQEDGRGAWPVVLGKLLLHPLCVALAAMVLSGVASLTPGTPWWAAAVLSASMPMFGIYPVLATPHGRGEVGAAALLLATLLSFGSVMVCLAWLAPMGLR